MNVTIQILDAGLETLETRNSRCQDFGYQMSDYVEYIYSDNNENVLYTANSISKTTMTFHFCITKGTYF